MFKDFWNKILKKQGLIIKQKKYYETIYKNLFFDNRETIDKLGVAKRDGDRLKIKYLVIHHSGGREHENKNDLELQDSYSQAGRNRGYKNRNHSNHSHPQINEETFAQYHFACHPYTKNNNPYGWRIVPLIRDPINNVAWHCSNWQANRQSIGIVICGNYTNKHVNKKALFLISDSFKFYAKLQKELIVKGHKDFKNTICPGKIYEQLDIIRKRL